MPTIVYCDSVYVGDTLSTEGAKYIAILFPVVAMVMMNRLESGDPVRGQCS